MHFKTKVKRKLQLLLALVCLLAWISPGAASVRQSPHGLQPKEGMAFLPKLAGLRNKSYKNQSGKKKSLSEAIVLRQSRIEDNKAKVDPGGLFYISETSNDAKPFSKDPFLILGEQAYLVDLSTDVHEIRNFKVNIGDRKPVGDTGYRIWFDYATDHYEKPYGEFALIAPSGGWPLEFPISSSFPGREETRELRKNEGPGQQLTKFYMDKDYYYGAMHFRARDIDFERAEFERFEFPAITQATFSMHRPIALEVRQDDYRLYFDKRIYAFRRPDGLLVRVTDFFGKKVFAEKLIKPVTSQGYKTLMSEKDKYHLTIPELDIRIEIMIQPSFLKQSDFVPWSTSKSHGFNNGVLNFLIYRQLISVKNGEAWPLDKRYKVKLEPSMLTGMLKRLVIENANAITFDNEHTTYEGPVKWSDIYNRPAFKVTADSFENNLVKNLFVRDYYMVRTDNLIFWEKEGRSNIDFFVGSSPVLEPILEDTFLTRLADSSFGTVVEKSHFTSYPKKISDASFYEPDHTAPFVPRLKGLKRKFVKNRKKERLISSESVFIRGSYIDWRNNRIVIPPAGLCYSTRNARNIRTLTGESFFMLGKEAYLTSFKANTFVKKNFNVDFWKNLPMGDGNLMYWQDELLGVRNKTLRMTGSHYLDDRPVSEMSLMKYSGNRWGAHFLMAQGLDPAGGNRYHQPEVFAEGATWIIPEYTGSNFIKIKEFGTPSIEAISFTYNKPQKAALGVGEKIRIGKYSLGCTSIDQEAGTAGLELTDDTGAVIASKLIGPFNQATRSLLPQYQDAARSLQFMFKDLQAELNILKPFKKEKVQLYLFQNIKLLKRDTPFEFDERFMVRPDVCGHCYQLNEVLLDNPEPIIIDRDNLVYEGPRREDGTPLFRIVVDDFDGEMIHAWHMETDYKGKIQKSDNLAFRPRNNLDVLVGVTGTTEGFLRLSMLPRLGFMESWRISAKEPATKLSGSVNTGGSAHIRR